MFHEYEIAVVVRTDIDEGLIKATLDKIEATITELGGHPLDREEWRKHKLAYAIEDHSSGYIAFLQTVCDPAQILEIERRLRLDESVLRFLTVKRAESVDVAFRVQQAAEVRKEREEEAARREAEAEAKAKAAAEAEAAKADAASTDANA